MSLLAPLVCFATAVAADDAWKPFEPVSRPAVPSVRDPGWVRNPIDAFIAAERDRHHLPHRGEAPRHQLMRRVHVDLTGLQPTPDQLRAFFADSSPDAYERLVDRLLESPQYGERWGRHWMDVWRYSDWAGWTGGNQIRDSQPHIWRWRDWIIESLNADKPYDRMILEMLAGDELSPADPAVVRATGYLVRNYKMLSREVWLQDTVKHTSQAFLGITLDCARCHEHKYDPFPQEDYYRFRAFFEPHQVRLDRLPGEPDTKKDGLARAFDADPAAATFLFVRGDDRTPDKDHPIAPAVPAALGGKLTIEPVALPLGAHAPEKQPFVIRETIEASERQVQQSLAAVENARQRSAMNVAANPDEVTTAERQLEVFIAQHEALLATLRVEELEDSGAHAKDSVEFSRLALAATSAQRWAALLESKRSHAVAAAAVERAQAAAAAAAQAVAEKPTEQKLKDAATKTANELTQAQTKLAETDKAVAKAKQDWLLPPTTDYTRRAIKVYPAASTGRRLALARWIADPANPLTARVAANHIWNRHFGAGLVPSMFDFGQGGRAPSHPELLDWLAAELMQPSATNGATPVPWSMKHLHRLIVTSATYCMASTPDESAAAADPDNKYYWRMNSRRMEAELVRDNVLWAAGTLDQAFGGPELDHQQGLTIRRRSMYFRHAAEKQMEFLKLFDAAGVNECYERRESVVPQQALALANSELVVVQSRLLARTLSKLVGSDPAAFVAAAFERVLARPAVDAELEHCLRFIDEQAAWFEQRRGKLGDAAASEADGSKPAAEPAVRARENLVHALLNHSDFVTVR